MSRKQIQGKTYAVSEYTLSRNDNVLNAANRRTQGVGSAARLIHRNDTCGTTTNTKIVDTQ